MLKIVLIDNNLLQKKILIETTREMLEDKCEIIEENFELKKKYQADIIFLNINIAEIDEVEKFIKLNRHINIILGINPDTSLERVNLLLEQGLFDYLFMPISPDEWGTLIQMAFK